MNVFSHPDFRDHEGVTFFSDSTTGLKAIIAIHSTKLGPALGGTRVYPYHNDEDAVKDVLRLSRGMTHKAVMMDIPLGGGKACIIADPEKDKTEQLLRSFGCKLCSLQGKMVSGEDSGMGVADIEIVAEQTRKCMAGTDLENFPFVVGRRENTGGSGDPSLYTAEGVMAGLRATLAHTFNGKRDVRGLTFGIQGFGGHVGLHQTRLLLEGGAKVIVAEKNQERLASAIKEFAGCERLTVVSCDDIYGQVMDVFMPSALGGILNKETIPRLRCRIVAGCANNQLEDDTAGAYQLHRMGVLYAPDYAINGGGLASVAEEYFSRIEIRDISYTLINRRISFIESTIEGIFALSEEKDIPPSIVSDRIVAEKIGLAGTI